jgi:hypothetical protein
MRLSFMTWWLCHFTNGDTKRLGSDILSECLDQWTIILHVQGIRRWTLNIYLISPVVNLQWGVKKTWLKQQYGNVYVA